MELFLSGIFILVAVWLGYKMGKGDKLELVMKPMRFAVRTESKENEVITKLEKMRSNK